MILTETGESRVRGYLFVLGRSLRAFLPGDVAQDAVREVESHIRERIEQIDRRELPRTLAEAALSVDPAKAGERPAQGDPPADVSERDVVERVLAELGPPLRVARAYSSEMTLDEAETTGRIVPMLRAIWHLATTSVYGFAWAIVALIGWGMGASLLAIAVLKPLFPNNVGLIVWNGARTPGLHVATLPGFTISAFGGGAGTTLGAMFPLPAGAVVYGGYWVIPISIVVGLLVLVLTQRLSRRMLGWLRARRSPGRLRVRLVVER